MYNAKRAGFISLLSLLTASLRHSNVDVVVFIFLYHIGEDVCRFCIGIGIGEVVQIFLRGLYFRVSEPCLNLSDVHAAVEEKRCRCVSETVELSVLESMFLEKLPELLGRCLWVHDLTVPLSEYPVITLPPVTKPLFIFLVLFLEHFYKLNTVSVYRYRSDLVESGCIGGKISVITNDTLNDDK